jgi:hypothetical protein
MGSAGIMLWVSLTTFLIGLVLMIRQIGRRIRELARGKRRVVEGQADLACQSIFLGAFALMQLNEIVGHIGKGTLSPDPWLSLIASTLIFVVFGASLGRLIMRWQLREVLAQLATGRA